MAEKAFPGMGPWTGKESPVTPIEADLIQNIWNRDITDFDIAFCVVKGIDPR